MEELERRVYIGLAITTNLGGEGVEKERKENESR